ncbi:MAG TPA: hypothetical protein VEF91_01865 [Verrucomicrobiae bacterium]|nr:hypothetical protein [Verrucomicrobiae bacterium]
MLSRSAKVKLKAILIIDLIIIGSVAGAYLYLQHQGLIAAAAKPATFTLLNLIINPPVTNVTDAVQISVNVTNIGDLEGNDTINLEINNATAGTENVTLEGGASQLVQFTEIELIPGNYTVQVGDLTGIFVVNPAPPGSSKIILSNMVINPYEAWANQPINVTATAENPTSQSDSLYVIVTVDGTSVGGSLIQLKASTSETVEFTVNATTIGTHTVNLNTLGGEFTIVKTGYHTLEIARSGGGSTPLPFILNGVSYDTTYTALLPVGQYTVTVPSPFSVGTGVLAFASWSDGSTSPTITFTLNSWLILVATYNLISGYASCPSLYTWNGTGYSYVTDVSNAGWLGYMGYMTSNGNIVYVGGNPWDNVKLDQNLMAVKNIDGANYYDMTLFQQADEIFYLDAAYLLVVDHPAGTQVYSSVTNYLNQGLNDQIYTVTQTSVTSPINATYVWGPSGTNTNGENVLPQISKLDGVFTPGNSGLLSPSWNNVYLNQLTLDLGNLSNANQIKLEVTGIVNWGTPQQYDNWIGQFNAAAAQGLVPNGTQITPPSIMEVKYPNGTWIPVPQDRQIPIPSDSNPRTFVVDLTGLFPAGLSDYQIKLVNFWNVTYDYIGIDTTTQQNITVQKISPIATLSQVWTTNSTASGNFTRYGDVTALLQSADNQFVIGRQGDEVTLDFPISNLTAPAPGMVRDYFFFVACWFKDPPGGWGYGFTFTVDPLPFMNMSGFPYTAAESYPYTAANLAYLKEYNTRVIPPPS